MELLIEWRNLPVDTRKCCFIPDSTVDGIGEVNRRRSFWKIDDIASGSEDKDTIIKDVDFHLIHELSVMRIRNDGLDLADPSDIFCIRRFSLF
jgi:hypothetical protein